jgi:glycerol-3-phosphate dehydrogenase (NAD(P)+)
MMASEINHIAIIGAGAWGSALALVARRAGRKVTIWAYEKETVEAINTSHENPDFLPGIKFDPEITASSDIQAVTAKADAVFLVTPAQKLRFCLEMIAPSWPAHAPGVICAKGIEEGSGKLMSEVFAEILPDTKLAVLSGPTFASEVAADLPTAVTLACGDDGLGERLAAAIGSRHFRPYLSSDVTAAEIGGAIKNVLAIAAGIVLGRGLGENARAALITRGLAEMIRLGTAKGAAPVALTGLAGFGDLCLTCTSEQSRNMSLGRRLGEGIPLNDILVTRKSVAEGVYSSASVLALSTHLGIEMPICSAVNAVLHQGADIDDAISSLLARPFTNETGT